MKRTAARSWPWIFFVGWLAWVVGVWVHGARPNLLGGGFDFERAGQFGDAFGPLSALMSALAAVGAWFALRQAREQAFETTFYSLLAHHNTIVEATDIQATIKGKDDDGKAKTENGTLYAGRDAYRRLLRLLRLGVAATQEEDQLERIKVAYKRFFNRYEDELAHYLRTLYHMVLFVDNSHVSNKELYMRIIRAQLSNSEQILLLYNVTVGKGFWKFKELVEKYSLLHNVRLKDDAGLWEDDILKPLMEGNAFRDGDADDWPTAEQIRELAPISE